MGALVAETGLGIFQNYVRVDYIATEVLHNKVHGNDCVECTAEDIEQKANKKGKIDRFERLISVNGDLSEKDRQSLLRIADQCPVHQTMKHGSIIVTKLVDDL